MDLENILLFPPAICGPIFMLTGFILLKFPPKRINGLYGYRTENSMKSQEIWDFSQRYSAKEMIKGGGLLTLTSVFSFFVEGTMAMVLGAGLLFLFIILLLIRTEKAIKKKFGKE